jgi:1-acyl-sn-glycerol-3-phosphate acyltransferase
MTSDKVREQQVPMEAKYPITIAPDYVFIRTDFKYLFFSHIAYTLFYWGLAILFFRVLGSHRFQGRKNIRPLRKKGFITVANHCHLFDTVLTGAAVSTRRPWFASVQRNFEAPYYRKMFRILRGFPIPDGVFGLRKIMKPVVSAVKRGRIVHLFPEEELWHLYQGVDYFQKGAFYLAHQANCPVVPIVHMFKPRKFFGKVLSPGILSITSRIGAPIYPDHPVTGNEGVDMKSVQKMCDQAQQFMKEALLEYHGGKIPEFEKPGS